MGNAFSYDLLHDRVSSSINLGLSVLNQCGDTLSSDFKCQNCPNLLLNGISFDETQIITLECLSNRSLLSQIQASINEYILTQVREDQLLGFPGNSFQEYLEGSRDLSTIISQNLIELAKSYIRDQQLYCTQDTLQKEFFAIASRLNSYLNNNVSKVVESSTTFKDLINLLVLTKVSQNKNKDLLIFSLVFIILFLIAIVLLLIGISCGYILILIIVVFIISLIILNSLY